MISLGSRSYRVESICPNLMYVVPSSSMTPRSLAAMSVGFSLNEERISWEERASPAMPVLRTLTRLVKPNFRRTFAMVANRFAS